MSISPIKYESKILSNLANMLKLSEKTDKEILSEIKEDSSSIKFEIDEDIKEVLDINKINCTCEESKKKIEEYKGKKFEYFYNVETYGVDFFLDICNALGRSNYKPFLTEEGKNEIMNGLRIRRNSNLYKYVSFFLSKERLNRDRLNDGKTPENIYHCFRCLKSVLHIYVDEKNSSEKKMYLKDKYITEEMEYKIENEMLKEKESFQKNEDHRKGIISVSKYKLELTSLSKKSNEKIMKDIFEQTKNMRIQKECSLNKNLIKKSNTFENVNNYNKTILYDKYKLKNNNDNISNFSNEKNDKRSQSINKKKKLDFQNNVLKRNSYKKNSNTSTYIYDKNQEEQQQTTPKNRKNRNSNNSFLNKNQSNEISKNNSVNLKNNNDKNVRSKTLIKKGNINKSIEKKIERGNGKGNKTSYELKNNIISDEIGKSEMYNETVNSSIISDGVLNNKKSENFKNYKNEIEIKNNNNNSNEVEYHQNFDVKFNSTSDEINKNGSIAKELKSKDTLSDEVKKNSIKKEIKKSNNSYEEEKEKIVSESYNEEEYGYNESDDTSYSTDDSNYMKYLRKKKKLQEQGKIVIDLDLLHGNSIKYTNKQNKEEKFQDKLRMGELKKILEEKKMVFCKIEDIAKKRNKRYVKTQVLSEDSKIERVYFSHKMKKFYNSKSGYFGCGWSNNKMEWTPFIHAPFFDNQHNAIYKNRNKKLYEEIYDTLLHGRIHPDIRIVELKDHKHPIRLCTPYNEDCYSIVYTGKKINSTDDRIIFGEYTGFVANNRELSQEKHQYMFALTFNKKVFNDKKNVVFINEIESDEEDNDDSNTVNSLNNNMNNNELSEKLTNKMKKNVKGKSFSNLINSRNHNSSNNIHKVKKSKNLNNLIILPDNYTYAVDSSYMFNEMSLVNHYKTCSIFNNYDFRINAEWQLVYLDGWPHIILTSIPGIEINPGEEIFADFGFEWFERVNDTCLNEFIKNNFEHRLNKLNLSKDKLFIGLDDIVEKYNLLKNNTTCNICMHNINTDGNNFIMCSGCNSIYHLKCVHKLNEEVNENYDWFCSSCIQFCLNLINQKEFLNYIEKENQKKLIDLFNDVQIDNLKEYNKSLSNSTFDKTTFVESQNDGIDNVHKCYENIRKLLQSKENINDLEKNKEILDDILEKKESENNLSENKENEDNFLKNERGNNLLLNNFEIQLLVYYKKKINDLLVIREKIDFFLNSDNYKSTLKMRKGTLNFLLQNKKCIEDFIKINENINDLLKKKEKNSNFVKEENEQKLKKKNSDNLVDDSSCNLLTKDKKENTLREEKLSFEKSGNDTSEIDSNFSNTYEKILYKKSNNIVKNLKEMRKKDKNNNVCCNYMMKLSKKYIGFPLIKDFEKGISTNQPSLPLNDHLKKLSVCSSCYNKHHDLAKAIICRVTKMHFHSNYNDCLTDEDLFKSSSECIQSVIRELANTIKEYRKKELNGAYLNIIKSDNSIIENDKNMNLEINFSNISPFEVKNDSFNKLEKDDKSFYEIKGSLNKENHHTNDKIFKENKNSLSIEKKKNIDNYDRKKEKNTLHNNLSETVNNKENFNTNNSNKRKHNSDIELTKINQEKEYLKSENNDLHKNKKSPQNEVNDSSIIKNNNIKNKSPHKNETLKSEKFSNVNLNNTKEILGKEVNNFNSLINNNKVSNFVPLFGIELGKTKFQREFTNGTFVGTVTKHIKDEDNNNFFVITYEDGDVEWITPCFLFQELLKQSTNNIEYPLASSFKDLFHQDFKKDIKLNNCSLELKIEKRKRKSNCEYNCNNNSITKRQKNMHEENSLRNKKNTEYDLSVSKRSVNKLKNSEASDSIGKKKK
ncbi:histone-lysine N-methyltransferase, H3 lysine-4 specific, putative [Plasmodium relictum]|uniref:Histone-lysine N-methyltransferase, H3 lysine-4 specific, putative n=1 Tax=Plasmodium relictum TaxID=85471 RepID=A0A1J1HAW8_PLARL|nr:histone-lysine N-methyltransferase, H3 lysine-4 specific, putative [Plasmodium relictum]CRH02633.1 histone-lysine N-methyltransferase, H3 lysine-4 specific, putative [Plasmodium relictum]